MPPASDSSRSIGISELIPILQDRAGQDRCSLAFDGDGTLWAGDVSDDVFLAACAADWLLPEVRAALMDVLERHELPTHGSASQLALRIFQSEKLGVVDERLLFEVMTWCYAGRSARELSDFAEGVLERAGIAARVRLEYRPLFDWAGGEGHACWLVTASPLPIVQAAARLLGFTEQQIIAARSPESSSGTLEIGLVAPLPYREQKVYRLREHRDGTRLLAAFGDSHFDCDLLRDAEIAVAVNPKPALHEQLETMARAVVLLF